MKKICYAAMAAAAMMLASCAANVKTATVDQLAGEWNVTAIDGKNITPTEDGNTPYIGFNPETGALTGNLGCNSIMGRFDNKGADGVIDFSAMGSTKMMCPEQSQEDALIKALAKVSGYRIGKDGSLELTDDKGAVMVALDKRPDTLGMKALQGEWKIVELNDSVLPVNEEEPYAITFNPEDSTFSAATGCNTVGGRYSAAYSSVTFDKIMQTRMMCPDMTVENAVVTTLPKITTYGRLASGNLGFYDSENNLVLILGK